MTDTLTQTNLTPYLGQGLPDLTVESFLDRLDQDRKAVKFNTVSYSDLKVEASRLIHEDFEIQLGEEAISKIGGSLALPGAGAFLSKVPQELMAYNLNSIFQSTDKQATFGVRGSSTLVSVIDPDKAPLPIIDVAKRALTPFGMDSRVSGFNYDGEALSVDIISPTLFTEVEGDGSNGRPQRGDITHGGIRLVTDFASNGQQRKRPRLQTYLHRLVCSNGMAIDEVHGSVSLRGNSVEDVLSEIEEKAQMLMGGLEARLSTYAATTDLSIPGNAESFIRQVGKERGLSSKTIMAVLQLAPLLPENPTMYDVMNLFTFVANEATTVKTRNALQELGGLLASSAEDHTHRCDKCEHLLV